MVQQTKSNIRKRFRSIRQATSVKEATFAEQSLTTAITQLDRYRKARKVACFLSFDGEIGTQRLIAKIIDDKSCVYLPKIRPRKGLWFLPYDRNSPMETNKFGIPEVNLALNHAIPISSLDLIIMPLVAFDERANRLGMGGGYYDATLSHLDKRQRPFCLGIAYEMQKVDFIPTDPWDIQLDAVQTESNLYLAKGKFHANKKALP